MSGIRKSAKIGTLRGLNSRYNLGYTEEQILNMSVLQLKKKIAEVKKKHKLTPIKERKQWKNLFEDSENV